MEGKSIVTHTHKILGHSIFLVLHIFKYVSECCSKNFWRHWIFVNIWGLSNCFAASVNIGCIKNTFAKHKFETTKSAMRRRVDAIRPQINPLRNCWKYKGRYTFLNVSQSYDILNSYFQLYLPSTHLKSWLK